MRGVVVDEFLRLGADGEFLVVSPDQVIGFGTFSEAIPFAREIVQQMSRATLEDLGVPRSLGDEACVVEIARRLIKGEIAAIRAAK